MTMFTVLGSCRIDSRVAQADKRPLDDLHLAQVCNHDLGSICSSYINELDTLTNAVKRLHILTLYLKCPQRKEYPWSSFYISAFYFCQKPKGQYLIYELIGKEIKLNKTSYFCHVRVLYSTITASVADPSF